MSENPDLKIVKPGSRLRDQVYVKEAANHCWRRNLPARVSGAASRRCGGLFRLHPSEENYWSPELCFVNVRSRVRSAIFSM